MSNPRYVPTPGSTPRAAPGATAAPGTTSARRRPRWPARNTSASPRWTPWPAGELDQNRTDLRVGGEDEGGQRGRAPHQDDQRRGPCRGSDLVGNGDGGRSVTRVTVPLPMSLDLAAHGTAPHPTCGERLSSAHGGDAAARSRSRAVGGQCDRRRRPGAGVER